MSGSRRVRRIVTAALTLCLAGGSALAASATEATQYQATARHDGRVIDPQATLPFVRAWGRTMDRPGYPIIADGRVFVIDRDGTDAGTRLWAFSLATGDVLWKKAISGNYNRADATYDSGLLFVINDTGVLSAYDPATGATVWTESLPGQYFFTAAPASADGTVYVNGSGSGGTLYAVNAVDGSIRWMSSTVNGDASAPTLSATRVFSSFACTYTQAFRRDTGKQVWYYDTGCEGGGGATAVLNQGLLYTRDNGDNRILDAVTGKFVGTYAATLAMPGMDGGAMYVLLNGDLRAIDLSTGNILWSTHHPNLVSNPLVVNGWVISATSTGRVMAFSRANGRLVWDAPVPDAGSTWEMAVDAPLTGLAVGEGYLVVPTLTRLVVFRGAGA